MIRPPGTGGIAFSTADDGDLLSDLEARSVLSDRLGISDQWATVSQVHGRTVIEASEAGPQGAGDALWTSSAGVPLAVFTADCFGVVALAAGAVGVAHAGWRGADLGVVPQLIDEMSAAGFVPTRLAIGPGIGPCCFEVGSDVAEKFPDVTTTTSGGSVSVDLATHLRANVDAGFEIWAIDSCTMHEPGWFSHRGTGTTERLAAIGWI